MMLFEIIEEKAMNEEIKAISKNDSLELATQPDDQKPIGVKWILKEKTM